MKKIVCRALLIAAGFAGAGAASAAPYTFTDLSALSGWSGSTALDINNTGQVVGYSGATSWAAGVVPNLRATLWQAGATVDLGTMSGFQYSMATAINNRGDIAGYSEALLVGEDGGKTAQGWVRSGAATTLLERPVGPRPTWLGSSIPTAINDAGTVAGRSQMRSGRPFGSGSGSTYFIPYTWDASAWNGGNLTAMETDEGHSYAHDINEAGVLVGERVGMQIMTASIWRNGVHEYLETTTTDMSGSSAAYAINERGQIVGSGKTQHQQSTRALLWDEAGHLSYLTGLAGGGTDASAEDITDSGLIVGYDRVGGQYRAVLWDETGTATDLNTFLDEATRAAGWVLTKATGINENGWIIGSATNLLTNETHAYLLSVSAVPDAPAMVLALSGLIVVAATRRRARRA